MKDFISTALLHELAAVRGEPCVSLYLPTHFAGTEVRQDEPRLDALLQHAEGELAARGIRSTIARDLALAARARVTQSRFWHDRSQGLAVFFSPSVAREFRTESVVEQVHVNDHFHLRPLLPLALPSDRFYVLGVSQQRPRLWRGTHAALVEVQVPDMPSGLAGVLHEVSHQGSLVRSMSGAEASKAVYHGQGSRRQTHDADLDRYLRALSRTVSVALAAEKTPLVLAGVKTMVSAYRQLQDYRSLAPEAVVGSVDALSLQALHAQAWAAALEVLWAPRRLALARRTELMGTVLATDQPAEVLRAAHEGRVETLFVSESAEVFGRFDGQQGSVDLSFEARPGDIDLVDLMLLETLRHGGAAYGVDDACTLSAILRY